ncbi:MAG: hypothetical protein MPN21_22610 [Thermoanaerobaculia bacterium]|nr:hypothetical protein [Thermoanaerobaculia bacterium]
MEAHRQEPAPDANWQVASTAPVGVTLTAVPNAFALAPGATQEITFTADVTGQPAGTWIFGEFQLTQVGGGSPDLHMPVAVNPALENLPGRLLIEAPQRVGSLDLTNLQSSLAITDLDVVVSGLVKGTRTTVSLTEDPTNDDAYDDLSQVFFKVVNVPAGARLLAARTTSDETPDADLFVGTGATPSAGTELCASATPTATEVCEIPNPGAGQHWILVQNWAGSASQPDDITLIDGIVQPSDAGNLTVDGPAAVASADLFDLDFQWNVPGLEGDDFWFATVDVGTDSGNPGNVETIAVTLSFPILFADGFESGNTSAWSVTVP